MKAVASLVVLLFPMLALAAPETEKSCVGTKVADFALRDYRGGERSLREFADRNLVVVVFTGTECPVARLYAPRLTQLAKEYESKGVAFLGISSNQQDGVTALAQFAKEHGVTFPILKDVGNALADKFGAQRTPEAYVLDKERIVRYAGRIDDQYGVGFSRPKPQRRDLAVALDELLEGKSVSTPVTQATGCFIGRVRKPAETGPVTYSKQIARIFQNRCIECHQPGEVAPFSLTTYKQAVSWADTIQEVVREQRMPPWHADPKYGKFSNDCRLSDEEKQLIDSWVKAGTPEGDSKDLPPPIKMEPGWRIGKPDVVFTMSKAYQVPAEGAVRYQYFVMETGFTEDKWVKAAEIKPGARSVVHHVIAFAQPPGGSTDRRGGFASGWLAATAPGAYPLRLAEGRAKRVAAGSRIIFQTHYTPNGAPAEDKTCIGLVFADPKTVRQEVRTDMVAEGKFEIPPHAENFKIEAELPLEQDTLLLSMMPHTHLRGKAFRYEAIYPGGEREIVLDVPRFDFNWQNTYTLAEPKRLPKGTVLHCTTYYDNSAKNPANPDPSATVRWGDQTWEEMMIGYFDMAVADQDLIKNPPKPPEAVKKDPVVLPADLKQLAEAALDSQEAFQAFAGAVKKQHAKVDRVCLTTFTGDKLRVVRAAYPGDVKQKIAESGFEVRGPMFALAYYALTGRTAVHPDLKKAKGGDLALIAKSLTSSMHVPVIHEGRAGTLSYWSKDEDAFPAEQHDQLKALADVVSHRR